MLPRQLSTNESNPDPDADLHRAISAFRKIGLYLKTVLCCELEAGTIDAAKAYPSTPEGVNMIIDVFKSQLAAYGCGEHPFAIQTISLSSRMPIKHWKRLLKNSGSNLLAVCSLILTIYMRIFLTSFMHSRRSNLGP